MLLIRSLISPPVALALMLAMCLILRTLLSEGTSLKLLAYAEMRDGICYQYGVGEFMMMLKTSRESSPSPAAENSRR
jgi:hypothetical protein